MPVEPSARAGGKGRRLLLVRHAKAVPKGRVEDFDRPLSDRGRRNAPETGRWLAGAGYTVDLALCSPSRRTRQTWELIVPELASPPPTVHDDRLYNATPSGLVEVLSARGGDRGSVLLVGHNPGIHELASALCGSGPPELLERLREGFPTSGVVVVDLADGWDGLTPGCGSLKDLWSPSR
ncbi:SixA phosphatase family protein [Streptomyces sp. LARHCF249]